MSPPRPGHRPVAARRNSRQAVVLALFAWSMALLVGLSAFVLMEYYGGYIPAHRLAELPLTPRVIALETDIAAIWILGLVYFLPSVMAGFGEHPYFGPIMLVNLLFGWIIIPWGICIIAAIWRPGPTFHQTIGRFLRLLGTPAE